MESEDKSKMSWKSLNFPGNLLVILPVSEQKSCQITGNELQMYLETSAHMNTQNNVS